IDKKWMKMEAIINNAAERSIPIKTNQKKKRWWDEECEKETETRNKLRIKALQTRKEEDIQKYKQQRTKVKSLNREKKENKENKKLKKKRIITEERRYVTSSEK